jgi:hypothetical protein
MHPQKGRIVMGRLEFCCGFAAGAIVTAVLLFSSTGYLFYNDKLAWISKTAFHGESDMPMGLGYEVECTAITTRTYGQQTIIIIGELPGYYTGGHLQTMMDEGPARHYLTITDWGTWYSPSPYGGGSSDDPSRMGVRACRNGAAQRGLELISTQYR